MSPSTWAGGLQHSREQMAGGAGGGWVLVFVKQEKRYIAAKLTMWPIHSQATLTFAERIGSVVGWYARPSPSTKTTVSDSFGTLGAFRPNDCGAFLAELSYSCCRGPANAQWNISNALRARDGKCRTPFKRATEYTERPASAWWNIPSALRTRNGLCRTEPGIQLLASLHPIVRCKSRQVSREWIGTETIHTSRGRRRKRE